MEANNVLKLQGYKALLKELGPVEAERFITLIQQENICGFFRQDFHLT